MTTLPTENLREALRRLASGEGLYAIGCFSDYSDTAVELRLRREFAAQVLLGVTVKKAWAEARHEGTLIRDAMFELRVAVLRDGAYPVQADIDRVVERLRKERDATRRR
jgi:hypothetical protein